MLNLTLDPHPLLDLDAFVTHFPAPLGGVAPTPASWLKHRHPWCEMNTFGAPYVTC